MSPSSHKKSSRWRQRGNQQHCFQMIAHRCLIISWFEFAGSWSWDARNPSIIDPLTLSFRTPPTNDCHASRFQALLTLHLEDSPLSGRGCNNRSCWYCGGISISSRIVTTACVTLHKRKPWQKLTGTKFITSNVIIIWLPVITITSGSNISTDSDVGLEFDPSANMSWTYVSTETLLYLNQDNGYAPIWLRNAQAKYVLCLSRSMRTILTSVSTSWSLSLE